eukprot:SAG11_NODE_4123_length_2054_cov_2.547315_1_plen_231_part_10
MGSCVRCIRLTHASPMHRTIQRTSFTASPSAACASPSRGPRTLLSRPSGWGASRADDCPPAQLSSARLHRTIGLVLAILRKRWPYILFDTFIGAMYGSPTSPRMGKRACSVSFIYCSKKPVLEGSALPTLNMTYEELYAQTRCVPFGPPDAHRVVYLAHCTICHHRSVAPDSTSVHLCARARSSSRAVDGCPARGWRRRASRRRGHRPGPRAAATSMSSAAATPGSAAVRR